MDWPTVPQPLSTTETMTTSHASWLHFFIGASLSDSGDEKPDAGSGADKVMNRGGFCTKIRGNYCVYDACGIKMKCVTQCENSLESAVSSACAEVALTSALR